MSMTTERARHVRNHACETLSYPADHHGECDSCHQMRMLWVDTETEECGDFEYCRDCWERRLATARKALAGGGDS